MDREGRTMSAAGGHSRRPDESEHFRMRSDGPIFTSDVNIDGWSHQSIWGRDVGRFFLTMWRDEQPYDSDPYLWISVADQHPLYSTGCVALALITRIGADPVAASAALQILSPAPATDPGPAIEEIANRELAAIVDAHSGDPDPFTLGEWLTYRWVLGEEHNSPATDHRYPPGRPGYREIIAEQNAVTGLVYQLRGHHMRKHYEGIDSALGTIVRGAITA